MEVPAFVECAFGGGGGAAVVVVRLGGFVAAGEGLGQGFGACLSQGLEEGAEVEAAADDEVGHAFGNL